VKSLGDIRKILSSPANKARPYVTFENKVLTYGELGLRVERITTLFAATQISEQNRLVICSDDDEVVITFTVAALLNGITSVVISPETKVERATSLLNCVQPGLIVVDAALESLWNLSKFNVFSIRKAVHVNSMGLLARFKRTATAESWLDDINTFARTISEVEITDEQLAFIIFTSGSTGQPKGVQISYQNLLSHLETFGKIFGYEEDSHILNNMMLAHADGLLQGPILTLYFGAQLYRPCGMNIQQLELYLNTIHRERISHAITVPVILNQIDRLTNHDDYFESEDFKCLVSVSGMLNSDLWTRLEQRFKIKLCNIYGLTETVLGGIFCGPDPLNYRQGSIGKPIDMDLIIVDENGSTITDGKEGELLLFGKNVFSGYYGDREATTATFQGKWFCTGDIARQDSAGFVYICGRKKEIIISGGLNIHPAEVNEVLVKHIMVAEVATVGFPDRDWGEIVVSAVVGKPNTNPSEIDLINHCRESLEEKKVPKRIVFLDSLPRGDAGKVQIPQLQKLIQREDIKVEGTLTLESFFTIAAKVFQLDSTKLSLRDRSGRIPGWDSLAHLNLILSIEKATGISFSVQEIVSIDSLEDIWRIINRKK
jgi:long-chain acyl-CoA synthetase